MTPACILPLTVLSTLSCLDPSPPPTPNAKLLLYPSSPSTPNPKMRITDMRISEMRTLEMRTLEMRFLEMRNSKSSESDDHVLMARLSRSKSDNHAMMVWDKA